MLVPPLILTSIVVFHCNHHCSYHCRHPHHHPHHHNGRDRGWGTQGGGGWGNAGTAAAAGQWTASSTLAPPSVICVVIVKASAILDAMIIIGIALPLLLPPPPLSHCWLLYISSPPLIIAKSLLPWTMAIPLPPPPPCTPSTLLPIARSIVHCLLCHPHTCVVAYCQAINDALIACKSWCKAIYYFMQDNIKRLTWLVPLFNDAKWKEGGQGRMPRAQNICVILKQSFGGMWHFLAPRQ